MTEEQLRAAIAAKELEALAAYLAMLESATAAYIRGKAVYDAAYQPD